MSPFKNVPVDLDTIIKKEEIITVGDFQVLFQRWVWEGIIAESLIFRNEDVEDISDDALVDLALQSGRMKTESKTTISRGKSGFTFLNINFENPM